MSAFEQLNLLKETAKNTYCPEMLMAINKRAQELLSEIENIKRIEIIICNN